MSSVSKNWSETDELEKGPLFFIKCNFDWLNWPHVLVASLAQRLFPFLQSTLLWFIHWLGTFGA